MEIEAFKSSDYQEADALWRQTKGMGFHPVDDTKEGIERFLKRNATTSFLAKDNGVLVGTIMAGHDGRRGFIYHLTVTHEYRNLGIASALVEKALDALKKEKVSKVALVAFKDNELGNDFWQTKGFNLREDLVYRDIDLTKN